MRRAAAAAAALLLLSACGVQLGDQASPAPAGGGAGIATATAPPTTSSTSTTSTTIATTTTALPPSKAVDGDPLSGNLSAEPIEWLDVNLVEGSGVDRIVAVNRSAMPIELELSFAEAVGVRSEPEFPAYVVVPPLATIDAAKIYPTNPANGWSYTWERRYQLGDPAASPASTTYLRPMLPSGAKATIGQRPGGPFSHTDALNKWAYDFVMPVGTPVAAARAGTVATIDQGFTEAGTTDEFGPKGNSVRVLHDDGTWTVYLHLDPRSARVRIGDHVEPGQIIGLSGNTGWSKGPHLHLALMANRNHNEESIKFALEGD